MEDSADIRVKLVELVNRLTAPHIPENPIVQDKIVRRVERGSVIAIVIGFVSIIQRDNLIPSCHIIDLEQML